MKLFYILQWIYAIIYLSKSQAVQHQEWTLVNYEIWVIILNGRSSILTKIEKVGNVDNVGSYVYGGQGV